MYIVQQLTVSYRYITESKYFFSNSVNCESFAVYNNSSDISRGSVNHPIHCHSFHTPAFHTTLCISNWLLSYVDCYPICGRLICKKRIYSFVRVSVQPDLTMDSSSISIRHFYKAVSICILSRQALFHMCYHYERLAIDAITEKIL